MALKISKTLTLPLDFATKTAAILAQRRKGKTYTASVIAEEMVAAKQPFVALDPTGAWWGMRAAADGESEGLPVVILGGQHADLPLERTGGRLVADLVVEEPGYYIVDFSLFESGEAERQFAVDFAERLYRAKGQPGRDFPLHLFVDEADRFVPQQIRRGSNETSPRLLGAFEAIVRRGGLRGLGTTLISQRAAVVNKNVLEMIDLLIALRTIGPNDRDAIDSYISAHGTDEQRTELLASLASLAIGEAWVWEPGAEPPLFERVKVRARRTFNSSATPKPGERRVEPKRLAPVDLAKYRDRMAETVERALQDDPVALRAELAVLKREMATAVKRQVFADPDALARARSEGEAAGTQGARRAIASLAASAEGGRRRAAAKIDLATQQLKLAAETIQGHLAAAADALREPIDVPEIADSQIAQFRKPTRMLDRPVEVSRPQMRSERSTRAASGSNELGKGERIILIAIAQHDAGVTREQLTVLTGYKRSSRDTYLQRIAAGGLCEQRGETITATDAGAAALGPDFEPLPRGAALREHWLARLPEGERKVLEVLVAAYPDAVERGAIDDATGYRRSSRDTYLQRLGARKLVESVGRGAVRASAELF